MEGHEEMKAAIYCRVSTEDQADNYSIPTQKEAIHNYAVEHDMTIINEFTDPGVSGSILDRPALSELRELVRSGQVDAVISFEPDRLSRDFVQLMVLANEFEQQGVELHFVTQSVGKTPEDKMLFGMKGLFAEYERTKILERTQRGIRERVKSGKFPSGIRARLYGYDYSSSEGTRYINEDEAKRVRDIYKWLAEGNTLNGITYELRQLGIPTPSGKDYWIRSTVHKILTNEGYTGKVSYYSHELTYPAIIEPDLFHQVQEKLERNKQLSSRNGKVKYLLRGHIICSRCGRKYWGYSRWCNGAPDKSNQRYYYCMGRRKIITPHKCDNRGYQADYLETAVWKKVEEALSSPQVILAELERRKNRPNLIDSTKDELNDIDKRLEEIDREQERLLSWAMKGFPEETIIKENERINQYRAELHNRKAELESRVVEATEEDVNLERVVDFCHLASQNLKDFIFEDRRLALSALSIEVHIDGDDISLTGAIPVGDTVSTLAGWCHPRSSRSGRW